MTGDLVNLSALKYSGFYAHGSVFSSGKPLPQLEMFVAHPSYTVTNRAYGRGIGFNYGHDGEEVSAFITSYNAQGVYQGRERLLSESMIAQTLDVSDSASIPSMALMQDVFMKSTPLLTVPLTMDVPGTKSIQLNADTDKGGTSIHWCTRGSQAGSAENQVTLGTLLVKGGNQGGKFIISLADTLDDAASTTGYQQPTKVLEVSADGEIWTKKYNNLSSYFATQGEINARVVDVEGKVAKMVGENIQRDKPKPQLYHYSEGAVNAQLTLESRWVEGEYPTSQIRFVEKHPDKAPSVVATLLGKSNGNQPASFSIILKHPLKLHADNAFTVDSDGRIRTPKYGYLDEQFLGSTALDEFRTKFNHFFDKYDAMDAQSGQNGWMRFHKGIYMQWAASVPGLYERAAGKTLRRFLFALPFKHACWTVQFTAINEPSSDLVITEITKQGFVLQSLSGKKPNISYIAIGE